MYDNSSLSRDGNLMSVADAISLDPAPKPHPWGSAGDPPGKKPTLHMRGRFPERSTCVITVTGEVCAVAEVGDQLGWLASALRVPPPTFQSGIVSCRPQLDKLQLDEKDEWAYTTSPTASCRISFPFELVTGDGASSIQGACWSAYFQYAVLVQGYPVLSRPCQNTGLELSLGTMGFLTGSSRVVRIDERIMMKGFSSLAIATLAIAGVVVWHLIVSEDTEERISYIDARLDDLEYEMPREFSLWSVESSRHIIGWCVDAVDLCGMEPRRPFTGLQVKPLY